MKVFEFTFVDLKLPNSHPQRRNAAALTAGVFFSPRRSPMKNAHLRLAEVEYSVTSKNWSTRVQVWCDRLATEDYTTHMLSLFGNDS
jgi:hypothetical protein